MGYLLSLALCTQFSCSGSLELHYESVRVNVCVVKIKTGGPSGALGNCVYKAWL